MKRYIKGDNFEFLEKIDSQIRNYLGNNLISATPAKELGFGRGGNVYMFKMNNHNVYRVFVDTVFDELVFQCIAEVFYIGKNEYYDEAADYKWIKGDRDHWFNLFKQWVNECETQDPTYTHYEYEE